MYIYPREPEHDRFGFYKYIVKDVEDKTVMDVGGNSGNLLYHSYGEIKEENYTCVDVDKEALDFGEKEYPKSEWIHHNTYNWAYNQNAERYIPITNTKREKYDHIFSYSLFSHTDFNELVFSLKDLQKFQPEIMAHSIQLTSDKAIANWYWHRRVQEYGHCIDFRDYIDGKCKTTFSVMDNNQIINNTIDLQKWNCRHLITFYNEEWLIQALADEGLCAEIVHPDYCYQSFIVLRS